VLQEAEIHGSGIFGAATRLRAIVPGPCGQRMQVQRRPLPRL
jgi:hypothetical protein